MEYHYNHEAAQTDLEPNCLSLNPLTICGILNKLFHLSVPQFLPLENKDNYITYLIRILNKIISAKYLEQCLVHSKHHVSICEMTIIFSTI